MKHKILFMIINMNIGGTEKALLNILDEIDNSKYEITLLMLEKYGDFLNNIPSHVKIEYLKGYSEIKDDLNLPPYIISKKYLKNGQLLKSIKIVKSYTSSKILDDRSSYFEYLLKKFPKREDKYDVAIAFAGPMDFISYYVMNKINAKKRYQWIHFDVTKTGFNIKFARNIYSRFDKIITVSEEAKEKLLSLIPELKDNIEVIKNIISPNVIIKMVDEGESFKDNFEGTRILTVGRLTKQKGQHISIPVLARLKADGYNVRWYCIGEGNSRSEYESLVKEYSMEEDYILLGALKNPYTMMRDCDIYVQPSIHEGFCITLGEAKCFNNPIVTTNFTGANEQISDGKTGLICNINQEDLYSKIKILLDNKSLMNDIRNNLAYNKLNSEKEILKIKNIIDL